MRRNPDPCRRFWWIVAVGLGINRRPSQAKYPMWWTQNQNCGNAKKNGGNCKKKACERGEKKYDSDFTSNKNDSNRRRVILWMLMI